MTPVEDHIASEEPNCFKVLSPPSAADLRSQHLAYQEVAYGEESHNLHNALQQTFREVQMSDLLRLQAE